MSDDQRDPRLAMLNLRPAPDGGLTQEEIDRAPFVKIPEGRCDYCEQPHKLDLPAPLTPECTHGVTDPPRRLFADRVRFFVMPDGRLQLIQELDDGRQMLTLIPKTDVERIRLALRRKNSAVMAERWRPE